jgi:hypothetical protein
MIMPDQQPSGHDGAILRRQRLGGMLHYYSRAAA